MRARDRATGLSLLLVAVLAWATVAWLLVNRSPVGQPLIQLAGAVAIGAAVGLTAWPLLWLVNHLRPGSSGDRDDWAQAARRALIVGLTVMVLVMLRGQAALSLPLAVFVVTLAVLVEAAFSLRR